MTDFDMVANSKAKERYSLAEMKRFMTCLTVSADKMNVINVTQWDESVRRTLTTYNLQSFILKEGNVPVDPKDVIEIMVGQEAEAQIQQELARMKARRVKCEDPEAFRKVITEQVLNNAKSRIESLTAEQAIAEKRGMRQIALFYDPLSAIAPEIYEKYEMEGRRLVQIDGKKAAYYLPESQEQRVARDTAWHLLVHSISGPKGLDKATWDHVTVGNVHELYDLIISQYMDTDRDSTKYALSQELSKLIKRKDETFAQFTARVFHLLSKMTEVGLKVDKGMLFVQVKMALVNSDDEYAKATCERVESDLLRLPEEDRNDIRELFKRMKDPMQRQEKKNRKKKEKGKDKKKQRAESDDESSSSSSEDDEAARTHRTEARNSARNDGLNGICLRFQDNSCRNGSACKFEHKKLSASQTTQLRQIVKEFGERKKAKEMEGRSQNTTGKPSNSNARTLQTSADENPGGKTNNTMEQLAHLLYTMSMNQDRQVSEKQE